jgi:hypothetical protein
VRGVASSFPHYYDSKLIRNCQVLDTYKILIKQAFDTYWIIVYCRSVPRYNPFTMLANEKQFVPKRRKPGPTPRLQNARGVTISLEDDLIEWGKSQPGGLSQMVREFLRAAKEKSGSI